MFSEMIREALGSQVVGQPDAIDAVARGVTRLASGLTPSERTWCAYLFLGPPGTGRAHVVRSLARVLHGREAVLDVSCKSGERHDPWGEFLRQLEPLADGSTTPFTPAPGPHSGPFPGAPSGPPPCPAGGPAPGPPRLVLVHDVEAGRKELFSRLADLLESGQAMSPGGKCIRLDGCMLFLTSSLCTDQILDETRLGFSGSTAEVEEDAGAALREICREEAGRVLGLDLLIQLDNVVVFRKLEEEHLAGVLDRHIGRMGRWLQARGVRVELLPAARDHLLTLATGARRPGAYDLVRISRREVEFPIGDLLVSGALEPGATVRIDHRAPDEHLHFSVEAAESSGAPAGERIREIPVLA